jgi:hypothetical protein
MPHRDGPGAASDNRRGRGGRDEARIPSTVVPRGIGRHRPLRWRRRAGRDRSQLSADGYREGLRQLLSRPARQRLSIDADRAARHRGQPRLPGRVHGLCEGRYRTSRRGARLERDRLQHGQLAGRPLLAQSGRAGSGRVPGLSATAESVRGHAHHALPLPRPRTSHAHRSDEPGQPGLAPPRRDPAVDHAGVRWRSTAVVRAEPVGAASAAFPAGAPDR